MFLTKFMKYCSIIKEIYKNSNFVVDFIKINLNIWLVEKKKKKKNRDLNNNCTFRLV